MSDARRHAANAIQFARSHTTGVLMMGELIEPVAYVMADSGQPVASIPAHTADTETLTLAVPIDDAEDSLQLLVEPVLIDPDSAPADRWKIYHGPPRRATFAEMVVTSAKFFGTLVDLEHFDLTNALADIQNTICREMNRDRPDDLITLCTHHLHLATKRPLMVGVDPHGFDIRAHAGIVRLEAPAYMSDENDVRSVIETFLRQAAQESGA